MSKKRKPDPSRSHTRKVSNPGTKRLRIPGGYIMAFLVALFAFLLYANTLGHGYVMDDDLAISVNPNVVRGIAGIPDIFTQPYRELCFGGCLYRPLTLAAFAIEWSLAPKDPFIGHLGNLLWYAATGALLFFTFRRLMSEVSILIPMVAAFLFIAHPVHTEVVANIKSRDEILSLFFVMLSVHQFAKWHDKNQLKFLITSGISFLAALFSKEGAITAFVLFPLVGWFFFQKPFFTSLRNSWWAIIPVGIFFLMRGAALSGMTDPEISMMDNPIVEATGTTRVGTSLVILARYLYLLIFPFQLISDYTYNVIPLQAIGSTNSIAGLCLYATIGVLSGFALLKQHKAGFFGLAFLAAISLYSQIPKMIGTLMGERLLYTPSLWFILGMVSLFAYFFKSVKGKFAPFRWKAASAAQKFALSFCGVVFILYSLQTYTRNRDWASNLSLYTADVVKAPNSVRLNDGYAEELYKSTFDQSLDEKEIDRRLTISESYSRKSLAIKPGISAYNNLGNVHFTRRKFEEAISYYAKCLEIIPNYETAKRNIAYTYIIWGRYEGEKNNDSERARELLHKALEYDENSSDAWHLIGISYAIQDNLPEAVRAFEKAYALDPTKELVKTDLRNAYFNMGLMEKAEAVK